MSLLFRIAVYLPVLFMIAVVVVGQQHVTAQETLRAAAQKTVSVSTHFPWRHNTPHHPRHHPSDRPSRRRHIRHPHIDTRR